MAADDFRLLLEWLSKEHVKQWWNDGDDTLEKVACNYGEQEEGLERFILVLSNEITRIVRTRSQFRKAS